MSACRFGKAYSIGGKRRPMNIEYLKEKLINHYKNAFLKEPCDFDRLTDDEILQLAKKLDLLENADDDTIEGIPAPIFFDLFN